MGESPKVISCSRVTVRDYRGRVLCHWKASLITRIYLEDRRITRVTLYIIGRGVFLRGANHHVEAYQSNDTLYFLIFLLTLTIFIPGIITIWLMIVT
ncbi:MAG: hypothetical protein AAF629_19090 [Chloroflexota bacterium]